MASVQKGYRFHDLRPRVIVGVAIGVVLLVVIALAVGSAMDHYYSDGRAPSRIEGPLPPQPRLGPAPAREAQRLLREKRKRLEAYGWVDRERTIVHIPIERAMRRFASRHSGEEPR